MVAYCCHDTDDTGTPIILFIKVKMRVYMKLKLKPKNGSKNNFDMITLKVMYHSYDIK